MASHSTTLVILIIVLVVALALSIGLAFTSWYKNMSPAGKTAYWVLFGGLIVILLIIIVLMWLKNPVKKFV